MTDGCRFRICRKIGERIAMGERTIDKGGGPAIRATAPLPEARGLLRWPMPLEEVRMNIGPDRSPLDAVNAFRNASQGQAVLVMQAGGAPGPDQGGGYEALHVHAMEAPRIAATPIG